MYPLPKLVILASIVFTERVSEGQLQQNIGRQATLNVIFQDGCGSDRKVSIGQARSFRLQYSTKTECKVRKHFSNPIPKYIRM